MTPENLRAKMQALDLSTGDIAIMTDSTRRAVQLWLSGANPVPMSVLLLLDAMSEGAVSIEWVADKIVCYRPKARE
jgi:hypothetical protein